MDKVKRVKEKYSLELLSNPWVTAVGIGTKIIKGEDTHEFCIKVYVSEKFPEKFLLKYGRDLIIPKEIEGVKTDIEKMSKKVRGFDAVNLPPEHCRRLRPAPGGCSISHYAVKGRGTLGCWVRDRKTGNPLLLSCWHVIANKGMALKGDPILQPSRLDGGKLPDDTIAYLERWVDVKMLGFNLEQCKERIKMALENGIKIPVNLIDAAVATPVSEDVVSYEILGLGAIRNVAETKIGDIIYAWGATSGFIRGRVRAVDVDIFIDYPPIGIVLFKDQVIASASNCFVIHPPKLIEEELDITFP